MISSCSIVTTQRTSDFNPSPMTSDRCCNQSFSRCACYILQMTNVFPASFFFFLCGYVSIFNSLIINLFLNYYSFSFCQKHDCIIAYVLIKKNIYAKIYSYESVACWNIKFKSWWRCPQYERLDTLTRLAVERKQTPRRINCCQMNLWKGVSLLSLWFVCLWLRPRNINISRLW